MKYPTYRMVHYSDSSDIASEYFHTMDEAVKAAEDTLREMDADGLIGQVEILMSSADGVVRKVGNYCTERASP